MMPAAYSRMIEQIPDARFVAWFRNNLPAGKVAAVAAWLLSSSCQLNGRILAVGGGRVARVAFAEGAGWVDREISAESIAAHAGEALDMSRATVLDFQADAMRLMSDALPALGGGVPILDRSAVIGAGHGRNVDPIT
jgi:hypothetical protein